MTDEENRRDRNHPRKLVGLMPSHPQDAEKLYPSTVSTSRAPSRVGHTLEEHLQGTDANEEWAPTAKVPPRPLIVEGEYEAVCASQKKRRQPLFKRDTLVLTLRILDGPYADTRLQRFYPASKNVGPGSAYFREWTVANNGIPPRRGDRLSSRKFLGKLFLVDVRTVSKDWQGIALPKALRYSKVAAIRELLVSNDRIH